MAELVPMALALLAGLAAFWAVVGLARLGRVAAPLGEPPRRRLADLLVEAGLPDAAPRDLLLVSLALAGLGGLLGRLALGWPLAILAGLAGGAVLPWWLVLRRRARRRRAVRLGVIELERTLGRQLAVNVTIQLALSALARSGPEALRPELARLFDDLDEGRLSFEAALARMQARVADPEFDALAAVLITGHERGARPLPETLAGMAEQATALMAIEDEAAALAAVNEASARLVAVAFVALIVALKLVNPGYMAVYDAWWGQLVLAGLLGLIASAYWLTMRIIRPPDEERVFR